MPIWSPQWGRAAALVIGIAHHIPPALHMMTISGAKPAQSGRMGPTPAKVATGHQTRGLLPNHLISVHKTHFPDLGRAHVAPSLLIRSSKRLHRLPIIRAANER